MLSSPPRFHVTARALDGTTAAQHNSGALVVSNDRDKIVLSVDITRVSARYGTTGSPADDPLSPPPPTGYHTAYDRGGIVGPNSWNLAPADGIILSADTTAVINQYGHGCIDPP